MIWVIGDIHGMLDPLARIIGTIRTKTDIFGETEKIIFLGDYIDHGPSSKEVLDLVMGLGTETVTLAGNHEDLLLNFMHRNELMTKYKNKIWFDNGALDTYLSFITGRDTEEKIKQLYHPSHSSGDFSYASHRLPAKYERFMNNLSYSHGETFDIDGRKLDFLFFHGLPSRFLTLAEQKVKTYREYLETIDKIVEIRSNPKRDMSDPEDQSYELCGAMECGSVWHRYYDSEQDYGGTIVLHGHTPITVDGHLELMTAKSKFSAQFDRYDRNSFLPFIFSKTEDAGYVNGGRSVLDLTWPIDGTISADSFPWCESIEHYGCEPGTIQSIDIDTGAVYGGALTAVGLSKEFLAQGLMPVLTAGLAASQREPKGKVSVRLVRTNLFRGDNSDKK